ncbi:MAG: hypothetical protein ACLFXM_06345, partial [Acidimicrobiia bacterium]
MGTVGQQGRRAWRTVATVLAVPMLTFSAFQVTSVLAREDREEAVEVDAGGLTLLDVDNGAGRVRVVGVPDADTVRVHASIRDGLRATGHRVERRADRLLVRGSCPAFGSTWCRADYTIEVPPDLAVAVAGRGNLTISDVEGPVTVETRQSSATLERVGGDVVARTHQGGVTGTGLRSASVDASSRQGSIALDFADSPRSVSASARQGSIEVVLPDEEGVAYAVDPSASQGSETILIRSDPESSRSLILRTRQGSITARY